MRFKDVSEVHNLSVKLGDPGLFDRVVKGAIEKALKSPPSPHSLGGHGDGGGKLVWFDRMGEPAPQEFVADPAIPKAFPAVLHGMGGSAKSYLALHFAILRTSVGGHWLGSRVYRGGKVLVVDFELNRNIFNSRVRKLARGMGLNPSDIAGLAYYEVGDTPTATVFEDAHKMCQQYGFDVVVIDSVGPALEGDTTLAKDVLKFYRDRISPLCSIGTTPLLIDHQARAYTDDEYQSKGVFGSSYKEHLARSVFQVQPKPTDEDSDTLVVRMRHRKANFTKLMKPFDVWITFAEDSISIERRDVEDTELLTERTLSLDTRILGALRHHGTGVIADLAGWLDAKPGSVGNAVRELKNAKRVVEVGKEGNAIVYGLPDIPPPSPPPPREHGDGGGNDGASSSSSATYRVDDDDEAREAAPKAPVSSVESLVVDVVVPLEKVDTVALDLETMPPEGWVFEVAREYRAWRKKLKTKPKRERQSAKWAEIKAKVYKQYAVDPVTAQVRLVSLATHSGINEVIDASKVDINPLLEVLKNKTLIIHNGSFDLGVLRERYGYVHQGRVLDTQLLYLLHHYAEGGDRTEETGNKRTLPDPTKKKGMTALATLAEKYLKVSLDKTQQGEDWSVPELPVEMIRYALEDSGILLVLSAVLVAKLEAVSMGAVTDLESRALPAIIDMERGGFPASVEVARKMADTYAEEGKAALKKLYKLTPGDVAPDGREWRWSIPEHVRAALAALGADLEELPKTKTGDPSTAKGALSSITDPPEAVGWVEAYLGYAALQKQERDFVNAYADLIHDGVIRGSYTKTVATGRLSCRKPNLQQVPARGELQTKDGMRVRSIFRAPEGHAFVVADFEQVELLLAATIAGEEGMLNVFREGGDIHRETAAWVLDKPKGKVTKAERTLAKALNFGLVYGCSAERLLESAVNGYGVEGLTLKKAKKYRKAFFEKYPALKRWHDKVEADCNRGVEHTRTPLGRRRKLPYWKDSATPAHTVAKNAPVQGAGADAIKLTLAKLFEDRHNCPGNPQLRCSVHDEVVLTVEEEHKDAAIAWVARHMADAEREVVGDPDSPIAVDVEARKSW